MNVRIENFQSLRVVEITIDRLTVLVGPSDRGKSAVIRALEGALFNRPGESFVRTGAQTAVVTVAHDGHTIRWRKGSGKNEFEIDGTLYSKVGTKAPDALTVLGFRDTLIGARIKEEGGLEGGTWMRPQVARQFDPIFLLAESGPFLYEVVVRLSRLGVLQRAGRQCALDFTSTKRLLTMRRADLETATAAAEKLAQAPLLRARLDNLIRLEREITTRQDQVFRVRHLLQRRADVQARLTHTLPVALRTVPLNDEQLSAEELREQYLALLRSKEGLARRSQLLALPVKLPKSRTSLTSPEYKGLQAALQRWNTLSTLIGGRVMRLAALDAAETRVAASATKYATAVQAVEQFRQETPVCPLCAQPWAQIHEHA